MFWCNKVRCKNREEAKTKAAKELVKLFERYKNRAILFMSSGGSSLDILECLEVDHINLTITVLDERFSENLEDSNFNALLYTKFYHFLNKKNLKVIDTRFKKGQDLKHFSNRFDHKLSLWREQNPKGIIIVTQGVGEDGHTAGIIPFFDENIFDELFIKTSRNVIGYNTMNKDIFKERVTVTIPFLEREVDHSIVYIVGQEKKEALRNIKDKNSKLNIIPGSVTMNMKNVKIFTDIV